MRNERPPVVLRPLHRWFFFWEDLVPSVYRVVAAVVAAAATSTAVVAAGVRPWWIVVATSVLVWSALAVVQDHDERIARPPDGAFVDRLRSEAEPVLAKAGWVFNFASGGSRARPCTPDVVLYEADPAHAPDFATGSEDCVDLWIERDPRLGVMGVSIGSRDLPGLLIDDPELAARVQRALDSDEDADALAHAFRLVFDHGGRAASTGDS